MKEVTESRAGLVRDDTGKLSSKRILAILAFIIATVSGFQGLDVMMWSFLGFSATALGITGVEKFKK